MEKFSETRNFINGNFIPSISRKSIAVTNPADQTFVKNIDHPLDEEIELAFNSASKAFNSRVLIDMDSSVKSKMMRSIASKLIQYKKIGGRILSQENGKTMINIWIDFANILRNGFLFFNII